MDDMFVRPKKRYPTKIDSAPEASKAPAEEFKEPEFVEPEKLAQTEETEVADPIEVPEVVKKHRKLLPDFKSWSKKKKIIMLVILLLVLLLGGGSVYAFVLRPDPAPPVVMQEPEPEPAPPPEPPKPTTEASKLTGLQITPELNQRSITAVMIENSVDARPQSGLLEAGVVFEAIAEGGITRFVALYQEAQPGYIGPVRSARPYFIDWMRGFDPAYAHAGGSPEALQLIKDIGIKDMDHGANGDAFERVSSRYAPHNLYTSAAKLDAVKAKRGFTSSTFTPLARKEPAPSATPTASTIDLSISSALYAVSYTYDAPNNSYKRMLANKVHLDEKSGTQLAPKVVVVLIVPYGIHPDGVHSTYKTIGSGKAYVFQDGIVTEGTWTKTARESQITLTDTAGTAIGLNPGQVWFTALANESKLKYSAPAAPTQ